METLYPELALLQAVQNWAGVKGCARERINRCCEGTF
jgi:hypothetical protein